MKDLCY